ncbi:AMP-binding protein [Paucibacter sp. TC2R-5]|uniref:AMP-binding protein n=1 Tax=Paucibacter sp. TC2R-5 TaxID=2893555 RepID=UPI0021E3CB7E|nr:AMP-binding protein [Paucibacter sp. TC2R-5]MCV2358595.1 AMP-binding protein [Paucibacter sp. TC2R-5]
MDQASTEASRPWLAQYGTAVPAILPTPEHKSLAALARAVARRFADQTAFTTVMPNGMFGSLSYAQVDEMSDAFAAYLRATLKLDAGDRVAVQLPNGLAYPVVLLGILKAGCVAVNTNPLYTPHEMAHQFKDSGVKAVVIVDMFADKLEQVLPLCPAIKSVVLTRVSEFFPALVGGIVHAVMKHWNKLIPAHSLSVTRLPEALDLGRAKTVDIPSYASGLNHDSLALLQYTGGTTGLAKGAMLSHGNLLWNMAQMRAMCASHLEDGREVVLTALPLYHIFAFTVNFLCMFEAGARNILVPNPRPVQNLQRAFENYPITWMTGVNTLYNALLNEEWFTAYPPKHLKAAGGGGAAMHHAVVTRFEQVTGAPLVEGYGLTEASPVVCFQLLSAQRQRDSIGVPAPMTELRLLDDEGAEVATGAPGELWLRGPQVMQGYWQQPAETAAVLRDGWLRTGDVAVMDAQGTFKIVDRKKDMILVNGFNVYPNEIEEALSAHPQILEAAVIGVPDAKTGEAVLAVVVRLDESLSEQAVLAHCRSLLTAYKLPARVEFRRELPKTAVGKILRRELRPVAAPAPSAPTSTQSGI